MKRKITILFFIIFIFTFIFIITPVFSAEGDTDTDAYDVMENGMPFFIRERHNIPLVNFAFAADLGSKDEDISTNGLIHILEHLLLLGDTKFRPADEINMELRRHGARFNAHTAHDSMVFELTLPAQHWKFGLTFLKEKLFHLEFTRERLDKEKEIIFEEISKHKDNPYLNGVTLALGELFKGHPYERPVIGDAEVIKKAGVDEIQSFYKRYFVASNCSLAIVGDIGKHEIDKAVREIFGTLEKKDKPHSSLPMVPPLKKDIKSEQNMDVTQVHIILGFLAPSSDHDDRLSFEILEEILGKGINPLLRRMLVMHGTPLVNGIVTRYFSLRYGGAFILHLTLDPKNRRMTEKESIAFLYTRSWTFPYSIDDYPMDERIDVMDYLENAKNNIAFANEEFQELGLNAASAFARFILSYKNDSRPSEVKESKQEPYMKRVEKINSSTLQKVASRYFSGKKYVMITILPNASGDLLF